MSLNKEVEAALSAKALAAKKEYTREYNRKNREKIREYMRKWRAANRDKVKQHQITYWEKKAREMAESKGKSK